MILEYEYRHEIPQLQREIPSVVKRILKDDEELIFRGDLQRWVLYRVLRRGGGPSDDYLSLEFILPGAPGEWLQFAMNNAKTNLDMAGAKDRNEAKRRKNTERIYQIMADVYNERQAKLMRGRILVGVP